MFGAKQARIDDLQTRLETYTNEVNDLRGRVQEKQNEIISLKNAAEFLAKENKELTTKNIALGQDNLNLLGQITDLGQQVTTQRTLAEHNQNAARDLEQYKTAYKRDVDLTRQAMTKQANEIVALNEELVNTRANLVTAHEQIKDLAYEADDLNRIVDLYDTVFCALRVPVKLTVRKRGRKG